MLLLFFRSTKCLCPRIIFPCDSIFSFMLDSCASSLVLWTLLSICIIHESRVSFTDILRTRDFRVNICRNSWHDCYPTLSNNKLSPHRIVCLINMSPSKCQIASDGNFVFIFFPTSFNATKIRGLGSIWIKYFHHLPHTCCNTWSLTGNRLQETSTPLFSSKGKRINKQVRYYPLKHFRHTRIVNRKNYEYTYRLCR